MTGLEINVFSSTMVIIYSFVAEFIFSFPFNQLFVYDVWFAEACRMHDDF